MFKIGDFSKLCRVPVSALRYYADIGLLEPAQVDPFTSYRYFSLEQLPRLNRILALKDLGLSLDQISQILSEELSAEQIRGMLRLKRAELSEHIEAEQARLVRVEARLRQIEQEHKMPKQEVILKNIEPLQVLSVREIIPTPQSVGSLIGESFAALSRQGIEIPGPPLAIFYDEEFTPNNLDVEVAFPTLGSHRDTIPLSENRALTKRELSHIPTAACIIHHDVYDSLTESYTALGSWIEANGYKITGPSREVYLSPPAEDGTAMTEIQFPVERA